MLTKALAVLLTLSTAAFAADNQLQSLYNDMYRYMIAKDVSQLSRILDDSFVLIHMTGMKQTKQEYLKAIENGILNYFSEQLEHFDVQVFHEDTALLVGQSRVNAAVFGGARHTWRLQLEIRLKNRDSLWFMTEARASTY